ncbi:MAG: hypothetical protein SGPRY_002792 [Prymnesium sp.]
MEHSEVKNLTEGEEEGGEEEAVVEEGEMPRATVLRLFLSITKMKAQAAKKLAASGEELSPPSLAGAAEGGSNGEALPYSLARVCETSGGTSPSSSEVAGEMGGKDKLSAKAQAVLGGRVKLCQSEHTTKAGGGQTLASDKIGGEKGRGGEGMGGRAGEEKEKVQISAHSEEEAEGSAVGEELRLVFPQALSLSELFGGFHLPPTTLPSTPSSSRGIRTVSPSPRNRTPPLRPPDLRRAGAIFARAVADGVGEGEVSSDGEWLDVEVPSDAADESDEADDGDGQAGGGAGWSVGGLWKDGMLADLFRRLRHAETAETDAPRCWLVLDGELEGGWVESLVGMVERNALFLSNGERLALPSSLTLLVEAQDASNASPPLLMHSSVLALSNATLEWRSLVRAWVGQQKVGRGLLRGMVRWMEGGVEATVEAMRQERLTPCCGQLSVQAAVSNMLRLLSAVLRRAMSHPAPCSRAASHKK